MGVFDFGQINQSNAYDSFKAGAERKKQNTLAQLAGDYAAGGAPNYAEWGAAGGDSIALRKDVQGQDDRRKEQLGQMAGMLVKAPPQMRAQLFEQMKPGFQAIGLQVDGPYTAEYDQMAQ